MSVDHKFIKKLFERYNDAEQIRNEINQYNFAIDQFNLGTLSYSQLSETMIGDMPFSKAINQPYAGGAALGYRIALHNTRVGEILRALKSLGFAKKELDILEKQYMIDLETISPVPAGRRHSLIDMVHKMEGQIVKKEFKDVKENVLSVGYEYYLQKFKLEKCKENWEKFLVWSKTLQDISPEDMPPKPTFKKFKKGQLLQNVSKVLIEEAHGIDAKFNGMTIAEANRAVESMKRSGSKASSAARRLVDESESGRKGRARVIAEWEAFKDTHDVVFVKDTNAEEVALRYNASEIGTASEKSIKQAIIAETKNHTFQTSAMKRAIQKIKMIFFGKSRRATIDQATEQILSQADNRHAASSTTTAVAIELEPAEEVAVAAAPVAAVEPTSQNIFEA